jgi:nucleotide-binding universal stress UspA family protein
MYKRALVPLDGSPFAETIIPFIMSIAGPLDLEVVLVRVVKPRPPEVYEGSRHVVVEDVEALRAEARGYLAPIAAELTARGVRVRTEVRAGDATPQIVQAAREAGADLIAMTTHGRGNLGRLVFGSVAEGVLRDAHVPVLFMRMTPAEVAARMARGAPR